MGELVLGYALLGRAGRKTAGKTQLLQYQPEILLVLYQDQQVLIRPIGSLFQSSLRSSNRSSLLVPLSLSSISCIVKLLSRL